MTLHQLSDREREHTWNPRIQRIKTHTEPRIQRVRTHIKLKNTEHETHMELK